MKKIKIISTYVVAIMCILSTLFIQPKETEVFKTSTEESNKIMIYMLDKDRDLVPVTMNVSKKESNEENILVLFDLMKQDFNIHEFSSLVPKSIQCFDVNIDDDIVKLNFNEAFLAMNSKNELRFIEGIVNSIVQLNPNYKVEFYVNEQKINKMPLSQLPVAQFDYRLGVNNFELDDNNLHKSVSRQVVELKSNDISEYYVVKTVRTFDEDVLSFVNEVLDDISMDLECLKIDANDEEWVLHLNEKFLLEENTIDQDKIIPLLYTLKMNQLSNHYVIKINDEVVRIDGFENESFAFHDLNLNIFEE